MAVLPTAYILITRELPLSTVPYQMYEALSNAPLLAVPFFILTAELMNSGRITERCSHLARELVGRIRGGLGTDECPGKHDVRSNERERRGRWSQQSGEF